MDEKALDDLAVRPRPMKRTKSPSAWKCCAVISVIVVLGGLALLGYGAYSFILWSWFTPLGDMVRATGGPGTVEPLIDVDTRMDVGLVVYARKPNAKTQDPKRYDADWNGGLKGEQHPLTYVARESQVPVVELAFLPEEEVIFSDIVLRDFSLMDKNKEAHVSFDLPLERFYDYHLWENDVRVAVMFIPTSGVLDKVTGVHSRLDPDPVRFPSVDEKLAATGKFGTPGSTARRVVEELSVNVPLAHIEINDLYKNKTPDPPGPDARHPNRDNRKGGFKMHPYFQSRVHLYMMNQTQPLDEAQYMSAVNTAWTHGCGPGGHRAAAHLLCPPPWPYLLAPNTDSWFNVVNGAERSDKMYGPYIRTMPTLDPRQYLRLPVNRNKTDPRDRGEMGVDWTDPSFPSSIPVNLTLHLSTIKPSREFALPIHHFVNLSSSEQDARMSAERVGVVGMSTSGRPVWTRIILAGVGGAAAIAALVLNPIYWWTRQTSTGISHAAAWMVLASHLAQFCVGLGSAATGTGSFLPLVFAVPFLIPPILQFSVVSPWVLDGAGVRRTIRHRVWTHRERASMRRELPTRMALTLLAAVCAASWALRKWPVWIVKPQYVPTVKNNPVNASSAQYLINDFFDHPVGLIQWILPVTTSILQLYLNRNSRTFAGQYAITAILLVVMQVSDHRDYAPFMGTTEVATGVSLAKLVDILLALAMAYQALTLPRVEQNIPDEDEE